MNPSKSSWASLKVGIVVLIGIVIFVFFVSVVGNDQNVFTSNYPLRMFMPNILGLVEGSTVSLGGLKIGYVKSLTFATKDSVNGIMIDIEVETKYRSSITTGTLAQIKTIGLLGDKYIDLTIGSRDERPLADNEFIPLRESFDIEMAGPQIKAALNDFTTMMQNMSRMTQSIERGEGSVGKLIKEPTIANEAEHFLQSLNATLDAIQKRQGTLGTMIYDPAMSKNLSEIASNLRAVTDQIRQGKGSMGKFVMEDTLYMGLSSFAQRADSLMAKANSDTSNVSKLVNDPQFYKQIMNVLNDLNLFLVDIRLHPERYLQFKAF
jgi:phospholipid/cholesterol/gamma-HCH transport system substrate-binding protein